MTSLATEIPTSLSSGLAAPRVSRFPPAPSSIEETGLPSELLVQLLVKTLFSAGELTEASGGAHLKLPYGVMKELFSILSPDYLDAVGLEVVQGRGLTLPDREGAVRVILVNEKMAERHWPDENPLGKRLVFSSGPREIVGVVSDAYFLGTDEPVLSLVYFPMAQSPERHMSFMVKASGDAAALTAAAREAIRSLDADQPIYSAKTFDQLVFEETQADGIMPKIMIVLAGIALVMAVVGVYGVMAYSVSRRTQELGIRIALGAQRGDVVRLVVRQGTLIAGVGIGIGLLLSLATTRALSFFLLGVKPFDLPTFGLVTAALGVSAVVACYVPARGASKVDPIVALRNE